MRPSLPDRLGYAGFRLLEFPARHLDARGRTRWGRSLGRIAWRTLPGRRQLALANIRRAFPDWSGERAEELVRRNFEHLGSVALDFLAIPSLSLDDVHKMSRLEEPAVLDRAREMGRGVLLLGAHLGNWEYSALVMAAHDRPISAIARRLSNPLVERRVTELRTRLGGSIIGHRNAVRPVLKCLRQGEMVGFLLDQRANLREGTPSEFFGQPVSTNQGLALLALKSGAPVVLTVGERTETGHAVRFGPVIEPPDGLPRDAAVAEFTRRFDMAIETAVRERPDQWFWVHDRWRLPREWRA